eukprot:SAG11_NODE_1039_length_6074_cov_11.968870_9_plen_35_part_00
MSYTDDVRAGCPRSCVRNALRAASASSLVVAGVD